VVKTPVANGDGTALISCQVIRSGRPLAEAEASAKADMATSPLTTLFSRSDEILVSTDDSGRTVVVFMDSSAGGSTETRGSVICRRDRRSKMAA
jgi:hypothetical protein